MLVSVFPSRRSRGAMTRRIVTGLALFALGYVAAIVASPVEKLPWVAALGGAVAARPAVSDTDRANVATQPPGVIESPRFDYFPDHYKNQAREPSEPTDTF